MHLVSVAINKRISKDMEAYGYTMFAMYQERQERQADGMMCEPQYAWINLDTWDEVSGWVASNPIGSPLVKQ